jgi:hypothetical protein
LAWTYLRRADFYPAIRNEMMLITAGATIGHIVFPLAPPRMLQPVGLVDTAALYGPGVYGAPDVHSFANQYAAMPSLHVAWALVVGGVLAMLTRSRWRWMWLAHPPDDHRRRRHRQPLLDGRDRRDGAVRIGAARRPVRRAAPPARSSGTAGGDDPQSILGPDGTALAASAGRHPQPTQRTTRTWGRIARSLLSGPVDTGPPRTALLRPSRIEPPEPALRRLAHPPRRGGQAWWSRQMGRLH